MPWKWRYGTHRHCRSSAPGIECHTRLTVGGLDLRQRVVRIERPTVLPTELDTAEPFKGWSAPPGGEASIGPIGSIEAWRDMKAACGTSTP